MSKWLRKNDEVIVIAGNSRGKIGKIIAIRGEDKLVVEGVNVRKKHMRRTREQPKGQIIDMETPIHISNVAPSVNGKAVRLRVRVNAKGEKELFYFDAEKKEQVYRLVRGK